MKFDINLEMEKKLKQQLKENPVLAIDTETGGFNPKTDALCSVAIMLPDGSESKEWFIKPYNKNYNVQAMKVNGLTKDFLEFNGVTLDIFKKEFYEYVNKNFDMSVFGYIQLLGHNVSFDIGFMKEVLGTQFKNIFHYHFKDSMILANMLKDKKLIPIKQSISLKPLYEFLIGEDELSKNAHTSLADTVMSLEIYNKLLSLISFR